MGLYNFQPRFVQPILAGEKTHTIRAQRKNPDVPRNIMHLYTGLRHKGAVLLCRVKCVKVEKIRMWANGSYIFIALDGYQLDRSECEQLAIRDGFQNLRDMQNFWQKRLPFKGHIYHWTLEGADFGNSNECCGTALESEAKTDRLREVTGREAGSSVRDKAVPRQYKRRPNG